MENKVGGVCTGNRETVESPATLIILSPGALNPHCAEESAFHPEGAGESRSDVRPRALHDSLFRRIIWLQGEGKEKSPNRETGWEAAGRGPGERVKT